MTLMDMLRKNEMILFGSIRALPKNKCSEVNLFFFFPNIPFKMSLSSTYIILLVVI